MGRTAETAVSDWPAVDTSRPPRDVDGRPVWRVRVAGAGELTCLDCGETTTEDYCPRCADLVHFDYRIAKQAARLVPTLQYLREGEYERI